MKITKAELNTAIVFDFFVKSEFDGMEEKLFKGVQELPPGHEMLYSLTSQTFQIQPYFNPEYENRFFNFSESYSNQYVANLRTTLDQTFKPLLERSEISGSLLSGGCG